MPILECRDLSKRFGVIQALDTVNLTIEPGRVIGLLGPNGSGKTTLLKLANGLLTPTGGEVLVNGKAPGRESRSLVSYLPDKNYLPDWMKALPKRKTEAPVFSAIPRSADWKMSTKNRQRTGETSSRFGGVILLPGVMR